MTQAASILAGRSLLAAGGGGSSAQAFVHHPSYSRDERGQQVMARALVAPAPQGWPELERGAARFSGEVVDFESSR